MGRRGEEAGDVLLLLAEASFEVGLEDLHDGDKALHLLEAAAELGFASPGAGEPSLGLGQPAPQCVHHHDVVGVWRPGGWRLG